MKRMGEILAEYRKACGLSQKDAAAALQLRGVKAGYQALSKWETGATTPSGPQLAALCAVYGIRDVPAVFCGEPPAGHLGRLNREGRRLVEEYARVLDLSGLYPAPREEAPRVRQLPLYRLAASAGTGQFLDRDDFDLVDAPDAPPEADFAVRLAGDSMEPRYRDGQTVFVRRQETLAPGEIGLFLYDGSAYCKQLGGDGRHPLLVSLNPRYTPLAVRAEELRVFGKVVG